MDLVVDIQVLAVVEDDDVEKGGIKICPVEGGIMADEVIGCGLDFPPIDAAGTLGMCSSSSSTSRTFRPRAGRVRGSPTHPSTDERRPQACEDYHEGSRLVSFVYFHQGNEHPAWNR